MRQLYGGPCDGHFIEADGQTIIVTYATNESPYDNRCEVYPDPNGKFSARYVLSKDGRSYRHPHWPERPNGTKDVVLT